MNKWLKRLALTCIVLGGAAAVALQFDAVQDALMDRRLATLTRTNAHEIFNEDDSLKVLVCGSGSPMSLESSGPCIMVIAGAQIWVVDAGDGATRNLRRWRVPFPKLTRLLITHFHSDHIAEIGQMAETGWINGRQQPLEVIGPTGIHKIVDGFNMIYAMNQDHRQTHHGKAFMNAEHAKLVAKTINPIIGPITLHDADGLKVQSVAVAHHPVSPAVGYRFDYKGRSVVISGDTNSSLLLNRLAQDADVFFHDALAPHMIDTIATHLDDAGRDREAKLVRDVTDYHASTTAAAKAGNTANVKKLYFYHTVPTPPNAIAEKIFMRGVSDVREDVEIAKDGLALRLPAGSDAIEVISFP